MRNMMHTNFTVETKAYDRTINMLIICALDLVILASKRYWKAIKG